jgi:hypothetical protein
MTASAAYVYIHISSVMYTSRLCIVVQLRALLRLGCRAELCSQALHNKRYFGDSSKMTAHRRCRILVSGFRIGRSAEGVLTKSVGGVQLPPRSSVDSDLSRNATAGLSSRIACRQSFFEILNQQVHHNRNNNKCYYER